MSDLKKQKPTRYCGIRKRKINRIQEYKGE